ncbi:MAG: hypothetical protein NWF10_05155 [Candidatus Bathyarchaeota archaeon]|nr:hypothetical protein [Candidatus Bathyarchaeota archaeon]
MLKKSLFFFGYILLQRYELAPLFAAPRKQYITLLSYIVSSRNRFLGGDKTNSNPTKPSSPNVPTEKQNKKRELFDDTEFLIATLILITTVILSVVSYFRIYDLNFVVGQFRLSHWFSWIGTFFIAIYSPIYFTLKRKYPGRIRSLLRIHIYGNLISFMLITIHFTQQISRPEAFFPDLSTGLALYIVMPILVLSGYLHRFRIIKSLNPHTNRYLHVSLTLTFYIIILVHVLQGLNII